jgi:hypothetical protein
VTTRSNGCLKNCRDSEDRSATLADFPFGLDPFPEVIILRRSYTRFNHPKVISEQRGTQPCSRLNASCSLSQT